MASPQYLALSEAEQHDMIVQTFLAQERDLFMYSLNVQRYETILTTLDEPEYREHLLALLATERAALVRQTHIVAATRQQLPEPGALQAALLRLRAPQLAG